MVKSISVYLKDYPILFILKTTIFFLIPFFIYPFFYINPIVIIAYEIMLIAIFLSPLKKQLALLSFMANLLSKQAFLGDEVSKKLINHAYRYLNLEDFQKWHQSSK
jgi:hypothetical protein